MTVKTGQSWTGVFPTQNINGALTTPSVGPVGVLYVDGVASAAVVTITGANPYKFSVTLPTLTAGQSVGMYITATISTIATAGVVASDQADTSLASDIDADVWGYATRTLTQAAASVAAAVAGSTITAHRGDTLTASLTGLGSIAARTKLWFTVKEDNSQADSASIIFLEESAGLTVVNGAAYTTTTDGTITVTNATTGALTITIKPAVTKNLISRGCSYDIQMLTSGGVVTTMTAGSFTATDDVTRAVS